MTTARGIQGRQKWVLDKRPLIGPQFETLAKRLKDECPEFGAWWTTDDIKMPTAGAKTVRPTGQPLMQLRYATFRSNDDPALRLVLMSLDPKLKE